MGDSATWRFVSAGGYEDQLFPRCSVFLICSGPSLNTQALHVISQRGTLTCAVNNAATLIRPQLWVVVDAVKNFSTSIWRDPGIMKFCPKHRLGERIADRDADGHLNLSTSLAKEMPNTFGFQLETQFTVSSFLSSPGFSMGCADDESDDLGIQGVRSVLLVAIKVLYALGARRVFLLGCDFQMRYGHANYAFEQNRSRIAVRENNRAYRVLNYRLTALRPIFERVGLQVFNCAPQSALTAFPFLDLQHAVEMSLEHFPDSINTQGMYDWTP